MVVLIPPNYEKQELAMRTGSANFRSLLLTLCAVLSTLAFNAIPAAAQSANPSAEAGNADASQPDDKGKVAPRVDVVAQVKSSIVVITSQQVGGKRRGVGTGFVVDAKGIIATNLHVIGEGQAFQVEHSDGRILPVKSVHASDRFLDLALIQVDPGEAKLQALELAADDMQLEDGAEIVAVGNPHGLKHSVVRGVLSAHREIDGRPMLQLAMPVEPGNSGGPIVDSKGVVHGVITMKSAVTDNLGFAMAVKPLRSLIEKPNPVAYASWRTIGQIDPTEWKSVFGADWRQLGGRILVRQPGKGFGGRSLLLRNEAAPKAPYELGVSVRMDDPTGAAGLVFHSNGTDRHYGFYPSGGKLRFTCFDGPTVFSWKILRDEASEFFRPGEFNHLKIRVDKDATQCFVNHHLVYTIRDKSFVDGQVGLAKFRDTVAEFRQFEIGDEITAKSAPPELVTQLNTRIEKLDSLADLSSNDLSGLAKSDRVSSELLKEESKRLEKRALELQRIAADVHVESVLVQLRAEVKDNDFDLLRVALLIARLDDRTVDVDSYTNRVERMAASIRQRLGENATAAERRDALHGYLFRENGYHGSRAEYDQPAKRYMHRVIDDRNGLPIMLATLYMELANRIEPDVEGVGLPGHFIVRLTGEENEALVDVFDAGRVIDRERAAELVARTQGTVLKPEHLDAVSKRDMAVRMMMNLGGIANDRRDLESLYRYLQATIAIDPDLNQARFDLARVSYLTGRREVAVGMLERLRNEKPMGVDVRQVDGLLEYIERQGK